MSKAKLILALVISIGLLYFVIEQSVTKTTTAIQNVKKAYDELKNS